MPPACFPAPNRPLRECHTRQTTSKNVSAPAVEWSLRLSYVARLATIAGLLAYSLSKVQPDGGFAYPPSFGAPAVLLDVQFGLSSAEVCAKAD